MAKMRCCPIPRCSTVLSDDLLMCEHHFKMVPKDTKKELEAAHKVKKKPGIANHTWIFFANRAIKEVTRKERKAELV